MDVQSSPEIPEIYDEVFKLDDSNLKDCNAIIFSQINGISDSYKNKRDNNVHVKRCDENQIVEPGINEQSNANSEKQTGRKNIILSGKIDIASEKTTAENENNFAEKSNVFSVNSFSHRRNKPCYTQNKTIEKEYCNDVMRKKFN